jgi:Peptidase family S41
MKIFLSIALLFFSNFALSQTKECTDIDFIVNKVKNLYSGYRDKVNNEGFEKLIRSVRNTAIKDTFENLSRLTLYFNDHHLRLFQKFTLEDIDKKICLQNLSKVKEFKKNRNKYQGYWINDLNSMIVFLMVTEDKNYFGYLVEAKDNIEKGFCVFKITQNKGKELITDYYNIARGKRIFLKSVFKNDSTLFCNSLSKWRKISNYSENYLRDKIEIQKKPRIDLNDPDNIIIVMPSFNREFKKTYDSLISKHLNQIRESKNLIIDIRNNGGGVINCFDSLLPYICSDTIRNFGAYKLINDEIIDGIKKNEESILKSKDTLRIQRYYKYLTEMISRKDSFYYSKGGVFFACNSKPNRVKNVGIIVNDRCLSAAELMIIYLRQSKKVTIFGEKSGGAVDYINASEFYLPKSKYTFWVATLKREISSLFPQYDNIGIPPDVEIPESNPDWIQFVKDYYGKN